MSLLTTGGMSSPAAALQLLAARSLPLRGIIEWGESAGELVLWMFLKGSLVCWLGYVGMIGMSSPAAAWQLLARTSLPPRAIIKRAKSAAGLCPVDFRKMEPLT